MDNLVWNEEKLNKLKLLWDNNIHKLKQAIGG